MKNHSFFSIFSSIIYIYEVDSPKILCIYFEIVKIISEEERRKILEGEGVLF